MTTVEPRSTVVLRSGERVWVRPIAYDDAEEIAAGFLRLSARSRYQRFFTGIPSLSTAQLSYLTRVDHHDHEALVALVPGGDEIIGVARYVRSRTQPHSAEIAMTIADQWQGRGLGAQLLGRLVDRAREEGITRFTAEILPTNRAMHALFRQLGPTTTEPDGTITATI